MTAPASPGEQQHVFHHAALPGLFALSASFSRHHFPLHIHDTCTMGVIVEGVNRFWNRGAHHHATRNTICVVNAGEPHTGGTCTPEGFSYFNLYIPDELFAAARRDLGGRGIPRFESRIIGDPDAVQAFSHLAKALTSPVSSLLVEERWSALCALLFARHTASRAEVKESRIAPRQVQVVRDILDQSCDDNLRLADLADRVGLSVFQLARGFSKHVGLPPHAYHLQRRIERARAMILNGTSAAEAAVRTGFSDQAHLTRHFRRHFGITPGRIGKKSRLFSEPSSKGP